MSIATDLIPIGAELVVEIVKLIMSAVNAEDPATLRKVGDVLPVGHALRSRLALLEAESKAEKELGR
jgi:hypothetical protein